MKALKALVVCVAVLVLALPAHAGSSSDPEIVGNTDPLHFQVNTILPNAVWWTFGAPEIRMAGVWWEQPNASTVRVAWEVVNASHRYQAQEEITYDASCDSGTDEVVVDVFISTWYSAGDLSILHANHTFEEHTVPFTVEGNVIHVDVPRATFAASTCTRTTAFSQIYVKGVGNSYGTTVPDLAQRAPDYPGSGRDAVFT